MAAFLSARRICEGALRRIGAYAINDSAARPQDLEEALRCLDDLVAELAGTVECFWLLTDTLSLPLTADTASYDLKAALGSAWPGQGIEYLRDAWIENAAGLRSPIELVRRDAFEARANLAESGCPAILHIDRLVPVPTLRPWPIPGADGFTLKLVIQAQSPTVAGSGPIPKPKEGESSDAGAPAAWNRWAKYALAAEIGSGPVRKLPDATTNTWRIVAEDAKRALLAFQNQEHETTAPVTASMDVLAGCEAMDSRW